MEVGFQKNEVSNQNWDVSKAIQEVQGAIIIAKKFPRCQFTAEKNIMNSCKRLSLAESALYSYPRGGSQITGPSIRLAEVLAQCWGNLDFGIRELEQRAGESTVVAYCWDLETNVRQAKVFIVPHERKARGKIEKLIDPRDIYELIANYGARRLRACILGIIPGDIVESAIAECDRTMKMGHKNAPIADRIKIMIQAFEPFSVNIEMIEKRLAHKIDATSDIELVALRKILVSLKDGMSKREDWFQFTEEKKVDEKIEDLNNKFAPKV